MPHKSEEEKKRDFDSPHSAYLSALSEVNFLDVVGVGVRLPPFDALFLHSEAIAQWQSLLSIHVAASNMQRVL